ncbi:hypothetical protein PENTCL1PPCAC_29752, partial [Pristionchus entomophagus]
ISPEPDVVTLDSSDEDIHVLVSASSQNSQRRAPKRKQDATKRAEDPEEIIIVEENHRRQNPGHNLQEEGDDEFEEGVPLEQMRNVHVLPVNWEGLDVLDKRVVVFGGDDYCIQQGQMRGARSVTVYRAYESEELIGSILALADAFQADGTSELPVMTDGVSWPSWPCLEEITIDEGDSTPSGKHAGSLHMLVRDFRMSETDRRRIEGVETIEAHWKEVKLGRWKLITNKMKNVPCDVLIVDQDLAYLTANKYGLSWSMAQVKEHTHR